MEHYSMNSIKNLAILSVFLAAITILCSWELLITSKLLFSSERYSSNISNSIYGQKDELEVALEKASMPNKTVIITIVNKAYVEPHESEYPSMFDLFLEGFWAGEETRRLIDHLLVVSMDKTAHERCEFRRLNCYRLAAEDGGGRGGDRFAWEKIYMSEDFIQMMWRRTHFLLDVLKRGYNFVFTDTDVLWLRNPFTILNKNETLDLQISTDAYNGSSSSKKYLINTGFYFIRSNGKTISLFQNWYEMRKNSTGLKEQDVLVNLIRHGALGKLSLSARFLKTLYFSGFCSDSGDVRLVVTVHANCCRSIRAKIVDLKAALMDWKRFKEEVNNGYNDSRNITNNFRWSKHRSCWDSWRDRSLD